MGETLGNSEKQQLIYQKVMFAREFANFRRLKPRFEESPAE
jgi:hypothetical protein